MALFAAPPNIDVHLASPYEASAHLLGPDWEAAERWLRKIVGDLQVIKSRRVTFPAARLDRLIGVLPPAQVTLDGPSMAVAKAIWAHRAGLKPLVVHKECRRLFASSPRWPPSLKVVDAPWTSIAALTALGIPLTVEEGARSVLADKLAASGQAIAKAGLAGTAVVIDTSHPDMLEGLGLPGLAFVGGRATGRYRMPILLAECLLSEPSVELTPDLEDAIRHYNRRITRMETSGDFPWTLYPFQARDAAIGKRILEVTGGVLLAGEMGSGKTTISLALAHEMGLWPCLVVSPLSAFSTWDRQLEEMGRNVYLATENPAKSWEAISEGGFDAVVISFDRLAAFLEIIEPYGFKAVIADEIQRTRTPTSRRSRALRALAASVPYRIGLSGTPLTNTVADLLPVGAFLVPGEWPPSATTKDLADMYPNDPIEGVAEHLGSMMVRRRMTDTGATLPKRNDHRVYVQLTPEQRRAIAEIQAEAEREKEEGRFDDNSGRMHAFARLHKIRQITNCPNAAGIPGPNPKVRHAVDLASDFIAQGRKGVIFTADRTSFVEIGKELDAEGIGWVGIWGATPPADRIKNEKRFHAEDDIKIVLCTIQAGAESWSASPTGTFLISTAYLYQAATLEQMECRVYRMSSDPDGPDIEIIYLHAQAPGGTLDDRMVEILALKKALFAQVVDRKEHVDQTKTHYSMGDLVYLLTGSRDERIDQIEADKKAVVAREEAAKEHARATLYKGKGRNKTDENLVLDDGSLASVLEDLSLDDDVEDPDDPGDVHEDDWDDLS